MILIGRSATMDATNKVWVLVIRLNNGVLEFLLLRPNPEPDLQYDYYVITGGVESGESPHEAASRETEEEIGLKPLRIIDLHSKMEYVNSRTFKRVSEYAFLIEVAIGDLVLNEEHIDYKWVKIDDFEREIWWEGSREPLKRIIDKVRREYNLNS